MPTATRDRVRGPQAGEATVDVAGQRNDVARQVETALSRFFRFRYHSTPRALLASVSGTRGMPTGPRHAASPSPRLYLFNFSEAQGPRESYGAWFDALHEVNERDPLTPILVTIRLHASDLIRRALEAGANEVISAEEAGIEELVRLRVQKLLDVRDPESTRDRPDAVVVSPTSPAGSIPTPGGDIIEEPEDALSVGERDEALARLEDVANRVPDAHERRGPYSDILNISVPGLRAPSGRLDAKKIAERFDVSIRQLARALPVKHQAISETSDSPKIQEALDPFARTADALDTLLPGERGKQWLHTPHPRLKHRTPMQALLERDGERVARMLELVRDGSVGG